MITLFLYSPSILSDSLVQGNKRWLAHMLYPPSILSDSFVQGNKRWFLDKRWLAHMLPLLISLETCIIIELLPNVKKSEWEINGTLHGSRNNWSNTRHIEIHDILKTAFVLSVTRKILPPYHCNIKWDYYKLFLSISK